VKNYFSGIDITFPLLSFEKALKLLRLLDFEKADIALNGDPETKHLYTYKELEKPGENGKKLLDYLNREGLKQTDLFLFFGDIEKASLNHPDKSIREKTADTVKRGVEYALAAGCKHMTILPGIVFDGDYGASLSRSSAELTWMADYAAQKGITLSVEAHTGSVADTPGKAMELLTMTKGLTLTLDHSHFIKHGAANEDINRLIPHASHMHVRTAAKGSSQTVFAESEIDYPGLIKAIKKYGYRGAITMEFCSQPWDNQNRVDTIGETVFLRDYLADNWDKVRS
jgi:sugar phosphate isomerase/epimerase